MRELAMPKRSPIAEQTPNAFHSIKFLISYNGFIFPCFLQKYVLKKKLRSWRRICSLFNNDQNTCLLSSYINIHTHHAATDGSFTVFALYENFEKTAEGFPCSIGLHPWYLSDAHAAFGRLKQYADLPNVLAIGECGLDKVTATDWQLQEEMFALQIDLANKLNKPLVIHCVRAFEELFAIFKTHVPKVPVVMHGFNKKPELADQLLKHGFYLSFGKAILQPNELLHKALRNTPADRFFLETDTEIGSIEEIYMAASKIRKTPLDEIILQLQKNYQNVFAR